MANEIALDMEDLRRVAAYAVENAAEVLEIFELAHPADARPRNALDAVRTFAQGGKRGKALRDAAWAAMRAAQESENAAASQAARAAMCASSAAYLHPLARSTQVKHILGASAHAARAIELAAGDAPAASAGYLERAFRRASPGLVEVLRRYPFAPTGGGRVGELMRVIDRRLRGELT